MSLSLVDLYFLTPLTSGDSSNEIKELEKKAKNALDDVTRLSYELKAERIQIEAPELENKVKEINDAISKKIGESVSEFDADLKQADDELEKKISQIDQNLSEITSSKGFGKKIKKTYEYLDTIDEKLNIAKDYIRKKIGVLYKLELKQKISQIQAEFDSIEKPGIFDKIKFGLKKRSAITKQEREFEKAVQRYI
ncbi:hypothetical protein BKH42_05395 [Helicobacter sp. 13S00482-2]|uniref:hypothetical protein n=1 Tax=Helicobacter sp. 13S00482-2 TaxID=1476200 RepID=UPI000BA5D946|nr:hypothetical protein [Helicobacter sp. 13S00482-2]PAF53486.1 hypothetical protein BKH42_05395 [Helicobacter sp. 13S00482-2]